MNDRTTCGKYEWIELQAGQRWEKGDILMGYSGKRLYGQFSAGYIIKELGYEAADQPGVLRSCNRYWIIRPIKYEENEFGEVSP